MQRRGIAGCTYPVSFFFSHVCDLILTTYGETLSVTMQNDKPGNILPNFLGAKSTLATNQGVVWTHHPSPLLAILSAPCCNG